MKILTNNFSKALIPGVYLCLLVSCGGGGGGSSSSGGNSNPSENNSPNTNTAPVAYDLTLAQDPALPFIEVQLQSTDADNDTLTYVFDSAQTGQGYTDAFISEEGILYATQQGDADQIVLHYKVSDGILFSDRASVTIDISDVETQATGLNETDPQTYGRLPIAFFNGNIFGSDLSDLPSLPTSVDLSGNFPPPGNQGRQGSCVGWAVAYALKSYQERLEEQWAFSSSTTFSPSFIYNQINEGQDEGSNIEVALKLIVEKGAATLSTMPYDQSDYLTQPSSTALAEASAYKAISYGSLSGTQEIKAALANRKAVVGGIPVYDSFSALFGVDSVYNTLGGYRGGHAITLVGYDDNLYGGAFKVINSYGQSWGDGGYFWLPYDTFGSMDYSIFFELKDATNTAVDSVDIPTPPVNSNLPNLQVVDWGVEYNGIQGGQGTWNWEVVNSGTVVAESGAKVNLMLSRDRIIDSTDHFLVYEEIPIDLEPGESAIRRSESPRSFIFSGDIDPGTYYMAVWVDDLQEVRESNELDNRSFGTSSVDIASAGLPDISIDYWWTSWNTLTGDGLLEYSVVNSGESSTSSSSWDINLVLSDGLVPEFSNNRYFLFYEDVNFILEPGQSVYRNETNPAGFNLFRDQFNNEVPTGTYYMSLWVDDLDEEEETLEYNNFSVGNNQISIENGTVVGKSSVATKSKHNLHTSNSSFNGKRLPDNNALIRKVEVSKSKDGTTQFKVLDEKDITLKQQSDGPTIYTKANKALDKAVFPRTNRIEMPENGEQANAK